MIRMKITKEILHNRVDFLWSLRNDPHIKGTTKSDEKGNPVFETELQKDGGCACGIMCEMFGQERPDGSFPGSIDSSLPLGKINFKRAREAVGVTIEECRYIQSQISDTPLSFPEIADRIETEIFNNRK